MTNKKRSVLQHQRINPYVMFVCRVQCAFSTHANHLTHRNRQPASEKQDKTKESTPPQIASLDDFAFAATQIHGGTL